MEQILKDFIDNNEAIDAYVTSRVTYISLGDVDKLLKRQKKQLLIHSVVKSDSEQLFCDNVIHHTCKWFDQYNGCMGCLVKKYEAK